MAQQPLHKVCAHIDLDAFYAQVRAMRKQHCEELLSSAAQVASTALAAAPPVTTRLPGCPANAAAAGWCCLAQVEAKQHPELQGKPVGVVQYNPYGNLETRGPDEKRIMNASNGSLIAVR